jgi:hypothetical protein
LNAGKCKSISFSRGSKPVMFQYVIGDSDLERVDVINDLGVLVDSRMTFVDHIGSIVSKSARILGFIKRISREFNNLAGQVWSMHRAVRVVAPSGGSFGKNWPHSTQLYKICIARSGLPPYESRCILLGLEVL